MEKKSPNQIPSPSTSPNSNSSSSSSNSSNGAGAGAGASLPPPSPHPPPSTPKSSTIPLQSCNTNPYPTTFVQADTQSFKQVVQMLTGSAETAAKRINSNHTSNNNSNAKSTIPPLNRAKKPAFKLYERRPSMKNLKMISPLVPSFAASSNYPNSPAAARSPLSPSILDFPSLALSPVTPLIPDPFHRSSQIATQSAAAEERAIAEKGFFLHPSPRTAEPPRLLPLFPVTSPRESA